MFELSCVDLSNSQRKRKGQSWREFDGESPGNVAGADCALAGTPADNARGRGARSSSPTILVFFLFSS